MIGGPETFPKGLNPFSEEFRQKLNEMAELCSAIKTLASNTPGSHAGTGGITIPEAETEEQERTLIQITAVDGSGRHDWKKVQLDSNGDPEDFTGQPTGTALSGGYAIELSGRSALIDDVVEAWPWTLSDGSQVMLFMLGGSNGMIPCVVIQTGGADGTALTPATWTYTATSLDAITVYGTNLVPQKHRPNIGRVAPGYGIGTGYYDLTGTFQLFDPNEALVGQACPEL